MWRLGSQKGDYEGGREEAIRNGVREEFLASRLFLSLSLQTSRDLIFFTG